MIDFRLFCFKIVKSSLLFSIVQIMEATTNNLVKWPLSHSVIVEEKWVKFRLSPGLRGISQRGLSLPLKGEEKGDRLLFFHPSPLGTV